jgi:hypothetical protein
MKTLLQTIQGADITLFSEEKTDAEIAHFVADMDVDCDGIGGNPFRDPYFQPETALKFQGKSLHAELVPYVVVPPVIVKRTKGIVLGSKCVVTNTRNGRVATAVVGDIGPLFKVGEGSPALCRLLGLSDNPNHGGTSDFIIDYAIYVGVPAIVPVTFALQKAA